MYEIAWVRDFFEEWPRRIPKELRDEPFYVVLRNVDPETLLPDQEVLREQRQAAVGENAPLVRMWDAWIVYVGQNQRKGLSQLKQGSREIFYRPEPFVLLAVAGLLEGHRGVGYKALRKALKIQPDYPVVQELFENFGRRRRPVLPFLARGNPVNVMLGRLRSRVLG